MCLAVYRLTKSLKPQNIQFSIKKREKQQKEKAENPHIWDVGVLVFELNEYLKCQINNFHHLIHQLIN